MQPQPVRGYRFAGFTLDLARRRLSGPGQDPIVLSGRAFDVLAFLLTCRDRMVTKRELMDTVWPRMVVEENNLTQAISTLRRVLGDSRESPQFIATIAGRGYQFVGDAKPIVDITPEPDTALQAALPTTAHVPLPPAASEPVTSQPAAAPVSNLISRRKLLGSAGAAAVVVAAGAVWWRRPKPTSRLPASIAVLPFKPLLSTSRNEAIEIGVAELLINRLSALPGVVVKPLSSVRRFSAPEQDPLQAGRDLAVAAVVDGYVQIQQDNVRLTARLLDVATGESLWAGSYTDKVSDFFAVQDALVTQLVSALAVEVPGDTRRRLVHHSTADPEAWQLYANGRYQIERRNPNGVLRAREFFQEAIARDPQFALAITGLSEAWALSSTFALVPPREGFEQARTAAQRALVIDPKLPTALVALGHVKTQLDHDWAAGRRLYREALSMAPNAAWAYAYLALNTIQSGTAANAIDYITRAQAIEPSAVGFMALSGFMRYHRREFDAARRLLSAVLESAPGVVLARQFLARVLLAQGDAEAVIRLLEGRNDPAPGSYSNLGRAYALAGNLDGARRELAYAISEGEKGFGVKFDLALLHLALGERDRALSALERAVDDGSQMIGYINVDPALDPIRSEPRVRAVARRIGLA
jgi:DNA-binding winged helix-turn-helix (wHTH) protein/TolB-like protein/tetratricopeptide (TPR) repeat protein